MAASSDDEGLAELFPDEAEEFARDSEHLAAKLAQANANVESLLIAIESERAARISLEERVDEVRGEAERSRAERNVLEAELAAARSLARGTDSVERSEARQVPPRARRDPPARLQEPHDRCRPPCPHSQVNSRAACSKPLLIPASGCSGAPRRRQGRRGRRREPPRWRGA